MKIEIAPLRMDVGLKAFSAFSDVKKLETWRHKIHTRTMGAGQSRRAIAGRIKHKQRIKVAQLHKKIAYARHHGLYKLSMHLIKNHDGRRREFASSEIDEKRQVGDRGSRPPLDAIRRNFPRGSNTRHGTNSRCCAGNVREFAAIFCLAH